MQSTRIRRISLIAGLFLVAAGLHARAAQTFNYADNFNSYGQFAVPAGWVTQDAIVPALPPGVFTGDTSPWANKAISPPGGVVNYNVAWSGGRRFSLIHPVETPLDSFRAVSAWYQGQGEPAYPLNLQLNSLHAEFDVSIRTGSACEDFPTNGVISSADGMTFAVQPVSDLATDVTRVGEVGGGLAWAGIGGFAIEFDLFDNGNEPADDAYNHVGLNVRLLWDGGEDIASLVTHLDPPASLAPGTLPDFKAVGDNNQPLHVTVFYNDPDEGGAGVVRVYLRVDPATKDPGEPGAPISYGMEPGDSPYGVLVLEACVGPWPTAEAIFGFTASTGQCDAVLQVDNVTVTADDEDGGIGTACTPPAIPVNTGGLVEIGPAAKAADCGTAGLGSPGWNVEAYAPVGYGIDALKTSIGVARFLGEGPIATTTGEADLNYDDGGDCLGDFANTRAFPGIAAGTESFGIIASGWICFPVAGDYVLQVRSDDGFEVVLGDGAAQQLVSIYLDGRICADATRATVRIAEAGVYPIRLLHFNGGGGAGLEVARIIPPDELLENEAAHLLGTATGAPDEPLVYGTLNGVAAPTGDFQDPVVTVRASEKIPGSGTGPAGFTVKSVYAPEGISIIHARDDDSNQTARRLLDAMADQASGAIVAEVNFRDLNEDLTPQPDGTIPGGVDFPGVTGDNFAVRASAFVTFPAAGRYDLWLDWDDHVVLKLGGQTLFAATSGGERIVSINVLEAGAYPLRIEHVEFLGDARVELGESVGGSIVPLGGAGSNVTVHTAATSGAYDWAPYGDVIPADRKVADSGDGVSPGWNTTLATAVDVGAGSPPVIDKSAYGTMLIENNHIDLPPAPFPNANATPTEINYVDVGESPAGRFAGDALITDFGALVDPAGGNDSLALSAAGYIEFPTPGDYALNINADDGGIVWIAGIAVTLYPFSSPPTDATPIVVHVEEAGLYDIRVDFFENGGGLSFEFFQYLPDGTVALINSPAATVSVYRELAAAPASIAYANPTLIPASAKAAEIGAGGRPGFRVQTANRVFVSGDGNRAIGGDTFRNLAQLAEMLDNAIDGVPTLDQPGQPAGDLIVDQVSFANVLDYPGELNLNDFGTRVTGYLELAAGGYLFEVDSDNGFNFWIGGEDPKADGWNVGKSGALKGAIAIPFYFTVAEDGLYKFVFEHLERDGLESCYFSQLQFTNGFLGAALVNGDNDTVRAYADLLPCNRPTADQDADGDVDLADFAAFQFCAAAGTPTGACLCLDRNGDGAIDESDAAAFANCFAGPATPADPQCE